MLREILYTMATNENGELTHIDQARKGARYYCPVCKGQFILRKSGRIGRGSKRPHFAHNLLTPNCTPEGVLHYSFKKLLAEALRARQLEGSSLAMNWSCAVCKKEYSGNLLENVFSIREEYSLGECKPDIALIDKMERVVAVIEVVVSHEPEDTVLQYYKTNHMVLVRIDLASDEDLKRVVAKAANPSIVGLCLDPRCSNYGKGETRRELIIETRSCNRCLAPMKACVIATRHAFGTLHSADFGKDEMESAKASGVWFEMRFENGTGEAHPQIICLNCKKLRSRYESRRF